MSVAHAAAAARYAHDLHVRHEFAHRGDVVPVPELLRDAARQALDPLLATAELLAVPASTLAFAEAMYADRTRDQIPRPPWAWGLVAIFRAGLLAYGRAGGGFSVVRFIEQIRCLIETSLPDAPPEMVSIEPEARQMLEREFAGWASEIPWGSGEAWDERVAELADRAVRRWAKACGVRLAYDSELVLTSTAADPEIEDEGTVARHRPTRRHIPRLPRERFEGIPRIADQPSAADDSDVAAVLAAVPASGGVFSARRVGESKPGEGSSPSTPHWRVARAVADRLLELEAELAAESLIVVTSGIRQTARVSVATLLAVIHFTEALPKDIVRAGELCIGWMEIRSKGMHRWQALLVWLVERFAAEIDAHLAAGDVEAADALLREQLAVLGDELPDRFRGRPDALATLVKVRLTLGQPSRAAVGPHGFAAKWCAAYGVPFPEFPSRQRPTRSARRLLSP